MGNHYRLDLFEDKSEQKAFYGRFNYQLNPPKSLEQLKDIALFFTRKKGELLKGKPLNNDFYGVALMSGNKPHINDEWSSILWAKGGKWFQPNYINNQLANFSLPENYELLHETAKYYIDLKSMRYLQMMNLHILRQLRHYLMEKSLCGPSPIITCGLNHLKKIVLTKNKNLLYTVHLVGNHIMALMLFLWRIIVKIQKLHFGLYGI